MSILLDIRVRKRVLMCWDEVEKKIQVKFKISSLKKKKTISVNSTMWCLAITSHQWSRTIMLKWMNERPCKCLHLNTTKRWDIDKMHIGLSDKADEAKRYGIKRTFLLP